MYGYKCEYCDGVVQERVVKQEVFKHRNGFVILDSGKCTHWCVQQVRLPLLPLNPAALGRGDCYEKEVSEAYGVGDCRQFCVNK